MPNGCPAAILVVTVMKKQTEMVFIFVGDTDTFRAKSDVGFSQN